MCWARGFAWGSLYVISRPVRQRPAGGEQPHQQEGAGEGIRPVTRPPSRPSSSIEATTVAHPSELAGDIGVHHHADHANHRAPSRTEWTLAGHAPDAVEEVSYHRGRTGEEAIMNPRTRVDPEQPCPECGAPGLVTMEPAHSHQSAGATRWIDIHTDCSAHCSQGSTEHQQRGW